MSLPAWGDEQVLKILAVHFLPYGFETPLNGLKGFDVEVIEAVFQGLAKQIKIEFLPWPRAVEIAYAGDATALLTCARIRSRDAHIYYSDAISFGTDGYFLRKDYVDPGFNSLKELRGQKIAAVRGYSTLENLVNLNIAHIAVRTDELALNVLHGKRVDIYYGPKEGNEFIAAQLGISNKIKFHPFKSKTYHLCFSKKWPGSEELVIEFNEGLSQLRADGIYQRIHDKYR